MPADPKLLDALCGVLAEHTGESVAVTSRRPYTRLDAGALWVLLSDDEKLAPIVEYDAHVLNPNDVGILVDVCDAYLQLGAEIERWPGVQPLSSDARASIVAAREKLRARL